MSKYLVQAAITQRRLEERGCDYETPADTLKEAKQKALHAITDEFALSGEMSQAFCYARVMRGKECIVDFIRPDDEPLMRPIDRDLSLHVRKSIAIPVPGTDSVVYVAEGAFGTGTITDEKLKALAKKVANALF